MKTFGLFLAGALCFIPLKMRAAQTAQARLFCLSVRFQQAVSADGEFTFDLTTLNPQTAINGELAPTFSTPTHFSFFREFDTLIDEEVDGTIEFDVPESPDANGNRFPDFFEVSQAVASQITTGDYSVPGVDSGTVKATWNRPAGSKDGTCLLQLKSSVFGQLPNFLHSFELIEYTGPLNYIPGTNRVSGSLDLVQTGDPSSHLAGAIEFLKSATNRFNELELQPGQWTNAAAQPLVFASDSYLRDELLKTNYYGYADFDDGDPNTADPDYYTWILSIDDANDADADSIPDFSDDPASTGPSAPSLGLSLGSTNLNLSISGTVGRSHEIQEISSLSQTNWTTTTTITLTNSPQVVSLPLPNGPTRFWRVRAL